MQPGDKCLAHKITDAGLQTVDRSADDQMIVVRGPFLEPLTGEMQKTLKLLVEWCVQTGLAVNPGKSSSWYAPEATSGIANVHLNSMDRNLRTGIAPCPWVSFWIGAIL